MSEELKSPEDNPQETPEQKAILEESQEIVVNLGDALPQEQQAEKLKSFQEVYQEFNDWLQKKNLENPSEESFVKFKEDGANWLEKLEEARIRSNKEGQIKLEQSREEGKKELAEEIKKINQEYIQKVKEINEKLSKNLEKIARGEKVDKKEGDTEVSMWGALLAKAVSVVAKETGKDKETADADKPKCESKIKEFFNNPKTQFARDLGAVGMAVVFKTIWAFLKFAKTAIQKKGNVGFGEGYKIGQEIFSFGDKKDKK
jgi:uncharacterized protein YaaR (DUF327 family)